MINSRVINILGIVSIFLGFSMIPSALWSLYYNEPDFISFIKSSSITILVGLLFYFTTRLYVKKENKDLQSIEGFTIVSLGWITMGVFSSLPFYFSNINLSFVDSFFEAMSGLTTTGATILGDHILIEDLSHGLLFWRSFTQFIGGMGIIVFSIAILPLLGIGGVQLFKAEVAGPTADKMTPRVKQTAKLLWGIYVGLVILLTTILYLEGMSFFDATCHSFTTIATAGFSTHSESIGFFNSPLIEWTIIVFMLIAATNFTLHYIFLSKGQIDYFKNEEFRIYLYTFFIISIIIFFNINYYKMFNWSLDSLRDSMFTTATLLTTTGFTTANYELWPNLSVMLVFILFFIGGTSGSTTGALKIIRTVLIVKYLIYEMKKLLHPNGIYNIKIGGKIIDENVVKNTLGFYLFYLFIFISSALIISAYNIDYVTALSTAASAIGNIGPGLGDIGPTDNWSFLPDQLKILSTFLMLLGRLEIFTVMVLFSRIFWKH
tara:strand:+ start:583 stop:2052 length:1470 start_codon:yes stop_codon:yes gene_type:complete